MATPEERITDPGPVEILALPDTGRTVMGKPGKVTAEERAALRRQFGRRAANVTAGPVAAGLAVRAADTGRVLMLQRALTDDDPAAGMWEFPGGKIEPDEDPQDAARREWSEEAGIAVPPGEITGDWTSSNGVYRGYVLSVPTEDDVPIFDGRDDVTNPDDPDGDQVEALAWWDPDHLRDNPAVRPELAADLDRVLAVL